VREELSKNSPKARIRKEEAKASSFFFLHDKQGPAKASSSHPTKSRAAKGCSKRLMFRRTRLCYLFCSAGVNEIVSPGWGLSSEVRVL
jgi:hypothetical protein